MRCSGRCGNGRTGAWTRAACGLWLRREFLDELGDAGKAISVISQLAMVKPERKTRGPRAFAHYR